MDLSSRSDVDNDRELASNKLGEQKFFLWGMTLKKLLSFCVLVYLRINMFDISSIAWKQQNMLIALGKIVEAFLLDNYYDLTSWEIIEIVVLFDE